MESSISNKFEIKIKRFRTKITILSIIVIGLLGLLIGRQIYLQILKGQYYSKIAQYNSIKIIPVKPPRGKIFDREGKVIVKDEPLFDLIITRLGFTPSQIRQTLCGLQEFTSFDMNETLKKLNKYRPFEPVIIKSNLGSTTVLQIAESLIDLPGAGIQVNPKRRYIYNELFSHMVGYLGEINKTELSMMYDQGYRAGDMIGKLGLERKYDTLLHGEEGGSQIEVDVNGRKLSMLSHKETTPGADITLTVDLDIEEIAYNALGDFNGTVIVMKPDTGEILALISKPDFNPNTFIGSMSSEEVDKLFKNPKCPMFNRTIQAQYAPGSIFKILIALAALEEGIISPTDKLLCKGTYQIGKYYKYRCFHGEAHHWLNITEAIEKSCNIFFYQVGIKLGVKKITQFATKVGFGVSTGIELDGEKNGFIPTTKWKKEAKGESWYKGDTILLSIGQGYILVTPLQVANLINLVANGGKIYSPTLVKKIVFPSGTEEVVSPKLMRSIPLSKETLESVRKGMEGTIVRGTGVRAYIQGIPIAGKTSTAQNPFGKDHAWFACYVPADNPKYTIVVMIEYGGKGGYTAVPVARKIIYQMNKMGKFTER